MKLRWLPALTALLLVSCVSAPDRFLLEKLDARAKARVLTDAGIEQYTTHLVQGADYEAIDSVRAYFATALSFDPSNARAQQYLTLVDKYRASKLQSNVQEADRLLAKKERTDDEDLRLVLAVQAASRLAPADEDTRRLLKATADIRTAIIKGLLETEQATLAKIVPSVPEDSRDRFLVDAYLTVNRAFAIDPDTARIRSEVARVKGLVTGMGARRLEAARKLIAAGKFTAARGAIAVMSDLNARSGGVIAIDVRTATYELNYQWAKWLFSQKDYVTAGVRIDAALAASRKSEATALKQRIADARGRAEAGESFDTGLGEADRLIGSGEMVAAWRKLDALAASTTESAKIAQLETRRQKVRAALKDLYDQGLARYREEKFDEAIEALDAVVQIDAGYEQAADYLEKARAKQKLIDQF